MFYKNNFSPAFVGAGAYSNASPKALDRNGIALSAGNGETDDFNSFHSTQGSSSPKRRPVNKNGKNNSSFLNSKTLLVAVVALVAVLLLVVGIVTVANASGNDITKDNNSFVSYEQNGVYYVAMNGEVIGSGFENEITITPAADNSFAYVIENTPDGYNVYLLEKKELSQALTSVAEVVTLAEYKPGIVYKDKDAIYLYSKKNDGRITRDATAGNFVISPDGNAVAYTLSKSDNVNEFKLYLYANGFSDSYATNMYPVEISNGGELIYAYGISSEDYVSKKLYVINTKKADGDKINIDTGFYSIIYMNTEGDEIIYCTGTIDAGFQSYIYNVKDAESHKIGGGICTPMIADSSIACLSSLKDIVVENTFVVPGAESSSATYYVNKKYESYKLSTYNGSLNKDGDLFYFINSENNLNCIDLNDKNRSTKKIAEGIVDFVITEKNNLYYITDDERLTFYKTSTGTREKISDDVTNMSMNSYSNILYFDIKEDTKSYFSEEGSGMAIAKFDRSEVPSAPKFVDAGQKRTFVYILDPDTNLYNLYYTSTGKTYKLISSDCASINGKDPISDTIQDAIDDVIDSVTP